MKTKLFLVSGWAFGGDALVGLAEQLESEFEVIRLAAEEALSPGMLKQMLPADQACVLVGWSLGGMLAIHNAQALPLGSALVLIGSTAKFCADTDAPHGVAPAMIRSMSIGCRRRPLQTLANFFQQTALPNVLGKEESERRAGEVPTVDYDKRIEGLRYLSTTDLRPVADDITVPSLLLHGRSDQVISPLASEDLMRRLGHASLHLLDNVGHDLPIRKPAWVAERILDFWKTDVC